MLKSCFKSQFKGTYIATGVAHVRIKKCNKKLYLYIYILFLETRNADYVLSAKTRKKSESSHI